MTNNLNQQSKITSLEDLVAEKMRLKKLCREKEIVLNEQFIYMQDHAGSLLFNALLPKSITSNEGDSSNFSLTTAGIMGFVASLVASFMGRKLEVPVIKRFIQIALTAFLTKKIKQWLS